MVYKHLKTIIFVAGLTFSLNSFAEFISCGINKIDKIMVQGEREDNHIHENSFVMTLQGAQCNEKPYLILKNDAPSYSSMLSIALAAKMADKSVDVTVNTNTTYGSATQISIIIVQ